MGQDEKYTEAMLMIQWLRQKHPLPANYQISLEILPETGVWCGRYKRKKVAGACYAKPSEARIVLAGKRALAGILKTVAHEFKHILQTVEGCGLKKHGKARERKADEFAEKVYPVYLEERYPEAPAGVQAHLETMLYLFRLDQELERIRASAV